MELANEGAGSKRGWCASRGPSTFWACHEQSVQVEWQEEDAVARAEGYFALNASNSTASVIS